MASQTYNSQMDGYEGAGSSGIGTAEGRHPRKKSLRLSKRAEHRLSILAARQPADLSIPPKQLAYWCGAEVARDRWLLLADANNISDGDDKANRPKEADRAKGANQSTTLEDAIAMLTDWQPPIFPLRGADIIARGVEQGPTVSRLLSEIEAQWVAEDFPPPEHVHMLLEARLAT